MKILIIGHGRHGKDTVREILESDHGMTGVSSSEFAAQKAVYPLMREMYRDWRECYEDRANHRELWFHAIAAYNLLPGPSLAEQILAGHDIYTGMRSRAEFRKSEYLFDLIVWVDRSRVLPPEPDGSMELRAVDADVIIDNNGSLDNLKRHVDQLIAAR